MKNRLFACFLIVLLCVALSACTSKIVSVNPDRVERMEVVELLSDSKVELLHEGESIEIKQQLIGQLQQAFRATGNCDVDDGHTYQVVLFVEDQVHANIIINSDGSVCKEGKRYVVADEGTSFDLQSYQRLFSNGETAHQFGKPFVPENIERGTSTALIDTGDFSYFYEHVKMNGKNYTILARANAQVPVEVILAEPEVYGDKHVHTFSYVQYSYKQSGETMLYFSDFDTDTSATMLYFFSLETENAGQVFDGQTSNMIVFEQPDAEAESIGWVVYEDMIVAVNLADGSADEGMTKTIAELGGMDEINGHFFSNPASGNSTKYAQLSVAQDNVLIITVMEGNGTDVNAVAEYRFDCATQQLVVVQEEENES